MVIFNRLLPANESLVFLQFLLFPEDLTNGGVRFMLLTMFSVHPPRELVRNAEYQAHPRTAELKHTF